jgi:hypothetical protein
MKLLFVITFFFLPFNIFAQDELYNKIKNDKDFIEYKEVDYNIRESLLAKRFVLPKNFATLIQQSGQKTDNDSIVKLLEQEGMSNAKEYMALATKKNNLMITVMQKYPELQKLPVEERNKLLMRLLSIQQW